MKSIFISSQLEKSQRKRKQYKRKEIIYEDYNQTLIDSLISFFCAEVETSKVALMLKKDRVLVELFYADFRKLIYEYQLNELHSVFKENPKIPVKRTYLDTTLCLYEYDRKLFVSKDILIAKDLKNPTKQEFLNIKVINSMLIRRFEKCCHKFFVEHRAAEHIWRRNKKYPAMLKELTKLIEEHSQAV